MDHIPTPLDSVPGIPVPLLVGSDYNRFKGYTGCPGRSESTAGTVAGLLQSRLYFGFLASFFETRIHVDEFTTFQQSCDGSGAFVTSKNGLSRLMKKHTPDPSRQHPLLKELIRHVWTLELKSEWHNQGSPINEVVLSIRILFHTLAEYCDYFNRGIPLHPMLAERLHNHGWCPSQIKHIKDKVHNEAVAYYLSCLPNMGGKRLDHTECPDTHCKARDVRGGTYQNKHSCTVRSSLESVSEQSQSLAPQSCPLIHSDGGKMRKIIEQGDIPLISILTSASGAIELSVRAGKPKDTYVAISHVWSDGLGNPDSNALPECQLARLNSNLVNLSQSNATSRQQKSHLMLVHDFLGGGLTRFSSRKPSDSNLFWMDTLCIPVGRDARTQELKSKAINQMAEIYGKAAQVLVLDSGLEDVRLASTSKTALLARIYYSGWMGRCWTYQEGSLTPHVYFQCQDGAVNPVYMFPRELPLGEASMDNILCQTQIPITRKSKQPLHLRNAPTILSVQRSFCEELTEVLIYRYMRGCFISTSHLSTLQSESLIHKLAIPPPSQYWIRHLVTVWNALNTRSTTKAEDVAVIFANLLGFDQSEVMQYPPEGRIKAMLLSEDYLPMSLLYNTGPRLTENELRMDWWIPTTLGRESMCEMPVMRRDGEANMWIDRATGMTDVSAPYVLMADEMVVEVMNKFLIDFEHERWQINCFRRERSTSIETRRYRTICLVFHGGDGHGALLLAACDGEDEYSALYDSPIRAIRCSYSPPAGDLKVLRTTSITSKVWKIKIINDAVSEVAPRRLIRRSRVVHP